MRGAELLHGLQMSPLFTGKLPTRPRLTNAEFAKLSERERTQALEVGMAIRQVPNFNELAKCIRELGALRFEAAVPVLVELWRSCPIGPIRIATGHALFAIGTGNAWAALKQELDDQDHFSMHFAVKTMFTEDGSTAFDVLSPRFAKERLAEPGGLALPSVVFQVLSEDAFGTAETRKRISNLENQEPRPWPPSDSRWIDLCVSLRFDRQLGDAARRLLRTLDPAVLEAALKRAHERERSTAPASQARANGPLNLLQRYLAGDHEEVWRELRSFGALEDEALREEATAVARATMQRVAKNARLVYERLTARGYPFKSYSPPLEPPALDRIDELERIIAAPVPTSLRAFWEVVGGINWIADVDKPSDLGVPGLALAEEDPLVVDSLPTAWECAERWLEERESSHPELVPPLELWIAPDYLHKANISGGAPYAICLPDAGADSIVENEEHRLPLVDYLRMCFRWAGFPRLARRADNLRILTLVSELTEGLEAF